MSARVPGDPRCKDCAEPHEDGRTRCAACAEKRRVDEAAMRAQRKKRHACVTCGKPAAKDRTLCRRHLEYYAARTAAAAE